MRVHKIKIINKLIIRLKRSSQNGLPSKRTRVKSSSKPLPKACISGGVLRSFPRVIFHRKPNGPKENFLHGIINSRTERSINGFIFRFPPLLPV